MKNYVVESYENSNEENRLTTNNARKTEFGRILIILPRKKWKRCMKNTM